MSTLTVQNIQLNLRSMSTPPLGDLKYILHNLLPYDDSRKIVKIEYRMLSADNEGKIEFSNFERKTGADLRAMWNFFF